MAVEPASVSIYNADVLKPVSAYVHVVDEQVPRVVITYDMRVVEAIRDLRSQIESLRSDIIALTHTVSMDASAQLNFDHTDGRSERELLKEIKDYFDKSGDQTVFPSDIAYQIGIPYDKAVALMEELEKDGKIAEA